MKAKSVRDKMKRERRKLLTEQLRIIADLLCDSHKDKKVFDGALERAERIVYELRNRPKLNDEVRKRFAQAFFESVVDQATIVEVEAGDLHLDGYFDFDELYKRFVIIDPKPVLQQVGGEDE